MIRPAALPFVLFIIVTNYISCPCFGQNLKTFVGQDNTKTLAKDTIIRKKLLQLNLTQFQGKTVQEFLQNDTVKLFKEYWWTDEPPGKLRSLNLTYARGLYLEIFVDTLKYQPRFSEWNRFSFEKFLKEKISIVKLDKDFFDKNVAN